LRLVLALLALPAMATAQDLAPSPQPPQDVALSARLVVRDARELPGTLWGRGAGFGGDLDGDSLPDIVIPDGDDRELQVLFASSVPMGEPEERFIADTAIELPEGCLRGDDRIAWGAGDLDGDGHHDLAVACFDLALSDGGDDYQGALLLIWGRPNWPASVEPDRQILGEPIVFDGGQPSEGVRPGFSVASPGDLDGDGYDDLVVTGALPADPRRPIGWVFLGGADARTRIEALSDAAFVLLGADDEKCLAPLVAGPVGDLDGDQRDELALGCPAQPLPEPGETLVDTAYSVWLGAVIDTLPPSSFPIASRSFQYKPSAELIALPDSVPPLGDLDGDGYAELGAVAFSDALSLVQGRVLKGHAAPWYDVSQLDNYWILEHGLPDPLGPFSLPGSWADAAALQFAPAPDLGGTSDRDVWIRQGLGADASIGVLTDPMPAHWADAEIPPVIARFGPEGGGEPEDEWRFSLGGSADIDGDTILDVLIVGGYSGGSCSLTSCTSLYVVTCEDGDADGLSRCAGDCDDADSSVRPGREELCDEVDQDCDGDDGNGDGDGDGFPACLGDCDDADAATFPGAVETCADTFDRDCDGLAPGDDRDGDGSPNCEDCQPWNGAMAPLLPEVCDGLDNDCDFVLPGDEQDVDRDGFPACVGAGAPADCDDLDAAVRPYRHEDCGNGRDDDCDGRIDNDADADADSVRTCDGDCRDDRADSYPGAPELCDGLDNDCDGVVDDGRDRDEDGVAVCAGDCDDFDATVFAGNVGQCGEVVWDADCDGQDDRLDGDGDGYSACAGDCDDLDPSRSPAARETCDRRDDDCDGAVDEDFDADADGWPTCWGDCDDVRAARYPRVAEPDCDDGVDGDCDFAVDTADSDCATAEPPPAPAPRPYGLGCRGGSTLLPLLLPLPFLRRRRAFASLLAVPLLLPPGDALAARKERAVIVYLAPQPDMASMQTAKERVPELDAADVLHDSELLPPQRGLLVEGAARTTPCAGGSGKPGEAATRALDRLIELDPSGAERAASEAIAAAACADAPVPQRLLPDVHYLRGLARFSLGKREEARLDFEAALTLRPDLPADPNFDPDANTLFEAQRATVRGRKLARVGAYPPAGGAFRLDGNDEDAVLGFKDVAPGLHIAQLRRGKAWETALFDVAPGAAVIVVSAADRGKALRDAAVHPTARAYAARTLADAALSADVDLAALVDLDANAEPLLYRPSVDRFSFEADLGIGKSRGVASAKSTTSSSSSSVSTSTSPSSPTSRSSSSPSAISTSRSPTSARAPRPGPSHALRARLGLGFALIRPFPYLAVPLDVGLHLGRGVHVDLGATFARAGRSEYGGIWMPVPSAGMSLRLPTGVPIEPRFGGGFQAGFDDAAGTVRVLPGWYGVLGADVLPAGPLLVGFDLRAGMLGKPFALSFGLGLGVRL
jgi:hypothetical protein